MYQKKRYLAGLVVCFLLITGGCSGLRGGNGLVQIRSMKQWQVLAKDVADNILATDLPAAEEGVCLYVQPAPGAFGEGFTRLINAELLRPGSMRGREDESAAFPSSHPDLMQGPDPDCYTVTITAQVVRYQKNRRPQYPFGTFTALSAGVLVMREYSTWEEQLILTGGMLADLFVEPPVRDIEGANSEVLITTSIAKDNKYLFVRNDLYMLRDIDGHLYEPPASRPARTFTVTGE